MSVINAKELRMAISKVLPCVDKWHHRTELQHILFEVKIGTLALVATDGNRIASVNLKVDLPDGEWLIFHKNAKRVRDDLRVAREVRIGIEKENLIITPVFEDREESVSLSPGDYPRWREVIPSVFATEATFRAEEMKSGLKEVKIKDEQFLKLSIEAGKIKLLVKHEEYGGKKTIKKAIVSAGIEGKPVRLVVFERRFRQAVNILGGKITLRIAGPKSPLLLEKGGVKWILAPTWIDW